MGEFQPFEEASQTQLKKIKKIWQREQYKKTNKEEKEVCTGYCRYHTGSTVTVIRNSFVINHIVITEM